MEIDVAFKSLKIVVDWKVRNLKRVPQVRCVREEMISIELTVTSRNFNSKMTFQYLPTFFKRTNTHTIVVLKFEILNLLRVNIRPSSIKIKI